MSEAFADISDAVLAARNGVVDIMVAPSDADVRVAARSHPRRSYYTLLTLLARLGAGALFAGLTAAFLWMMQPDLDAIGFVSTALAGSVVGIAAFRFAIEREWKRRLERDTASMDESYRLIADGRSLSTEDAETYVRMSLDSIYRIVETPHHLIIFTRSTPVLAVPRTAFPRPEIATAFADFLRSRIAAAEGFSDNRDPP